MQIPAQSVHLQRTLRERVRQASAAATEGEPYLKVSCFRGVQYREKHLFPIPSSGRNDPKSDLKYYSQSELRRTCAVRPNFFCFSPSHRFRFLAPPISKHQQTARRCSAHGWGSVGVDPCGSRIFQIATPVGAYNTNTQMGVCYFN